MCCTILLYCTVKYRHAEARVFTYLVTKALEQVALIRLPVRNGTDPSFTSFSTAVDDDMHVMSCTIGASRDKEDLDALDRRSVAKNLFALSFVRLMTRALGKATVSVYILCYVLHNSLFSLHPHTHRSQQYRSITNQSTNTLHFIKL